MKNERNTGKLLAAYFEDCHSDLPGNRLWVATQQVHDELLQLLRIVSPHFAVPLLLRLFRQISEDFPQYDWRALPAIEAFGKADPERFLTELQTLLQPRRTGRLEQSAVSDFADKVGTLAEPALFPAADRQAIAAAALQLRFFHQPDTQFLFYPHAAEHLMSFLQFISPRETFNGTDRNSRSSKSRSSWRSHELLCEELEQVLNANFSSETAMLLAARQQFAQERGLLVYPDKAHHVLISDVLRYVAEHNVFEIMNLKPLSAKERLLAMENQKALDLAKRLFEQARIQRDFYQQELRFFRDCFSEGQQVLHDTYGVGTVTQLQTELISVMFSRFGEKQFRFPQAMLDGHLRKSSQEFDSRLFFAGSTLRQAYEIEQNYHSAEQQFLNCERFGTFEE